MANVPLLFLMEASPSVRMQGKNRNKVLHLVKVPKYTFDSVLKEIYIWEAAVK